MQDPEENEDNHIRQLANKLPNGMSLNSLIMENKDEAELSEMLQNIAQKAEEVQETFK